MCGIAGFVDSNGGFQGGSEAATALVGSMCDVIRHRGPDDEGVYVGEGAALGMRRLSIIDLATGHQPIHNEDRTVWVVFNGEIYNYRELRSELAGAGHSFYTSTDTETIVHAYEQWGDGAFDRLRGMFGIALWDRRTRTLLLARDRVGIKPLHYAQSGGRLVFGSEIKSILASGAIVPTLDPAGLDHYLSFLYAPRDASIFAGIRKLPPGHLLRWSEGRVSVESYWTLSADESFSGSAEDAAAALSDVLARAVRAHMVSDVPIGAFLSGGVDSSLVVGLMAQASPRPIKTFSIGFDEPEFDELDAARRVARHFGTDHHELVVQPDAVSILDDLVEHFDEPFGDASAIPTWYVSRMAGQRVKVVLSGDGGDELFGGYDRYVPHPRVASFDRLAGRAGRRIASVVWPWLPHGAKGKNFLRHASRDPRGRYLDSITFFQSDEKDSLLSADVKRRLRGDVESTLARRFDGLTNLPWASQLMHFDFETYLPEDILTKVDRMSMAHSIESRVPLLDHEVVTFAASLPSALKVRKQVLKQAASGILPADVLGRRKQGFGVPVGVWFRGRLREVFGDILQSARTRQRGYFETRFVDRIVADHLSGRRDHTLRLWLLLMFELWHRRYLDGPGVPVFRSARAFELSGRSFPSDANRVPQMAKRAG